MKGNTMSFFQRVLIGVSSIAPQSIRKRIFKAVGLKIGEKTIIGSGFFVDRPECVTLGTNCFINRFVHLHVGANKDTTISLGNNVFVGPDTKFVCVSHEIGSEYQRAGKNTYSSIVVEDGVWIAAGATILPGVIIAKGCVIGAGAVVTKSTEMNGLYLGVPAKRVRDL